MSDTIRTGRVIATLVVVGVLSAGLLAQTAKPEAPGAKPEAGDAESQKSAAPQLRVQITIARYAGEKKTTSLPFALWVSADGSLASLNAGQRVYIPNPDGSSRAENMGTSISCRATPSQDGRFRLQLTVTDGYLSPARPGASEPVILKSLAANNLLHLRDGQTAEFAASTDLVTGEVTRIEVTATVLK